LKHVKRVLKKGLEGEEGGNEAEKIEDFCPRRRWKNKTSSLV